MVFLETHSVLELKDLFFFIRLTELAFKFHFFILQIHATKSSVIKIFLKHVNIIENLEFEAFHTDHTIIIMSKFFKVASCSFKKIRNGHERSEIKSKQKIDFLLIINLNVRDVIILLNMYKTIYYINVHSSSNNGCESHLFPPLFLPFRCLLVWLMVV